MTPAPDPQKPQRNDTPTGESGPVSSQQPLILRDTRPFVGLGEPPSVLTTTPNAMGLLVALKRRWFLALMLGLVCAGGISAALWYLHTPKFTVRTVLNVAAYPRPILPGVDTGERGNDFANYQRTQIASVKSRMLLNSVLRNPKVAELPIIRQQIDPLSWLERNIQADFAIAPEFFRIFMVGEFPPEMIILVDAVREAYLKEVVYRETDTKTKRLDQLKRSAADYETQLQSKRETLKNMAEDLGSNKEAVLGLMQTLALKHLGKIQEQLLETQSDLRKAQLDLLTHKTSEATAADSAVPDKTLQEHIAKDELFVYLSNEVEKAQEVFIKTRDAFTNPEKEKSVQIAQKAVEAKKKELADRIEQLRPQITAKFRATKTADLKEKRAAYEATIRHLTQLSEFLTKEVDDRTKATKHFNKRTVNLQWLQDEIAQVDEFSKRISAQIQAQIVEKDAPERITVWEPAAIVAGADGPHRKLALIGGGTFAVILLGIALLEFRIRRVNSIDQVVRGLKMRVVGALPALPNRARRGMIAGGSSSDRYWQSLMTESVDSARTMLLNMAQIESLRAVMITSAVGGEGKTLLSSHLAVSLARAGCKTLLVDGDLRRPSLHRLFSLADARGLSEVLRGEITTAEVVQPGPIEGLSVLAAGETDSQAIQALSQRGLSDFFNEVREQYDFIIVDSAPVLPVADSSLLAQQVDGVIFSILRDVSRLPSVYAAYERLAMLRIRILGAVVNGTRGDSYGTSYTYQGGPGMPASV
jgi:succinoglycan biosynthesis transport protein ExoP